LEIQTFERKGANENQINVGNDTLSNRDVCFKDHNHERERQRLVDVFLFISNRNVPDISLFITHL